MKRPLFAAMLIAGILAVAVPSGAAPGALDSSFGQGGGVPVATQGWPLFATGVALQRDGRIVAAVDGERNAFVTRRYLADGTIDTGFAGGEARAAGTAYAEPHGTAVQSDGKVVVGGRAAVTCPPDLAAACGSTGNIQGFALARFNADGSLDAGFGTSNGGFTGQSAGTVVTAFTGNGAAANAVVVQPDGKLVAAGTAADGKAYQFALARYNPDGTLDTSFGSAGTVITPIGSASGAVAELLTAGGKLLVAGQSGDTYGSNGQFALARYNPDGSLDTSFGAGGTMTTTLGKVAAITAVALQPDGRIVAAGWSQPTGSQYEQFALARYNPDGSLDTSFGSGGTQTTVIGQSASASAVVLQPNGEIMAAGTETEPTWCSSRAGPCYVSDAVALARYTAKGTPDAGFGTQGVVTAIAPNNQSDTANAAVLQPDGKLVTAGTSLLRFEPSDSTLAVHTKITMQAPKKAIYRQSITYTIKVADTGSTDVHNVTVVDSIPAGVDPKSISTSPAGNCSINVPPAAGAGANGSVICHLGTLTHHGSTTFTLSLVLPSAPGRLVNTAADYTTDREMSPSGSTHTQASVKVTCPAHQTCPH